jgi:hypothetical protein
MFGSQRKGVTKSSGWREQMAIRQPNEALQNPINFQDPPRYRRQYVTHARSSHPWSLA